MNREGKMKYKKVFCLVLLMAIIPFLTSCGLIDKITGKGKEEF